MSQAVGSAEESPTHIETDTEFQAPPAEAAKKWDELRRFPRYPVQATIDATIYPLDSSWPPVRCEMMTRDLSRGGINLLHSEQLYPGQKIDIVVDSSSRRVEVVWCRRITNRCFSAGCRFVTS
jgi:hypothetical protein